LVKSIDGYVGEIVTLVCQDWWTVKGELVAVEDDFLHLSNATIVFSNQPAFSDQRVKEISISKDEVVCILKGDDFTGRPTPDDSIR